MGEPVTSISRSSFELLPTQVSQFPGSFHRCYFVMMLTRDTESKITSLPPDVLISLMRFLHPLDLIALRQVSFQIVFVYNMCQLLFFIHRRLAATYMKQIIDVLFGLRRWLMSVSKTMYSFPLSRSTSWPLSNCCELLPHLQDFPRFWGEIMKRHWFLQFTRSLALNYRKVILLQCYISFPEDDLLFCYHWEHSSCGI